MVAVVVVKLIDDNNKKIYNDFIYMMIPWDQDLLAVLLPVYTWHSQKYPWISLKSPINYMLLLYILCNMYV